MFIYILAIFVLSALLGYFTVWNVAPSLHSPLMSVTNAISGVVLLGALKIAGNSENIMILSICLVAVFLSGINLAGGFTISERMLQLFKKKENK